MLVLTLMRWMSRTRGPLVVRGPQFEKHCLSKLSHSKMDSLNKTRCHRKEESGGGKQQVLSTIVLMLDVITSFYFLFFPNDGLKK
jgi:hypothetical protein